ncbi:relaxase/mobilization nuclease domain-containing protein [Pseudomonas sp. NPDC088368]|uniref:relaxase/mobilization nuclease domain-containing protein n=1 Tax=Pseudomonas sp. NPDC088368 TaxID=3364453 RepID=UPI00381A019F
MIHKKCHSSSRCEAIIRYMFAASMKAEDQAVRPLIEYLGGNLLAPSPFGRFNEHNIREVDTRKIEAEFNAKMALYKGTGSQLVEHHVLSLPLEDTLTDRQFKNAVRDFLELLGADASTTWVAARHSDAEHSHVHIALCRVQALANDGQFSHYGLMSNKNDYERAIEAVRQVEKKYGLTQIESPGEDLNAKNQAAILRAIGKSVLAQAPLTVSDFVLNMAAKGVCMRAEVDSAGQVHGLAYRLNSDDGRWISGSKIMASKLTFGSLKDLLDYSPQRDDRLLGVGKFTIAVNVEPFRRSTKIKKLAVLLRTDKTVADRIGYLHRYPQLDELLVTNEARIGVVFHINLLTKKNSAEAMEWAVWEELVRTVTQNAFRMLGKSFSSANYEFVDLGPAYRETPPVQIIEISGLSPSTINNILERLSAYLNSDEFLPEAKEINPTKEKPRRPDQIDSSLSQYTSSQS